MNKYVKPFVDLIQSTQKDFARRFRYAVVRDGITQQVVTTYDYAAMFCGGDDELWLAFVNTDNGVELIVRIDGDD